MTLTFTLATLLAQYSSSVSDGGSGGAVVGLAFLFIMVVLLAIGLAIWLLAGIIAQSRRHPNRGAIWALTLLAGWTCIGWVAAFIWAFIDPSPPSQSIPGGNPRTMIGD
jgi:hypothetical protein